VGLRFTKMHGIGNDFVVIDARATPFDAAPDRIARIADRHRGVGFDQLLTIEAARSPGTAFHYGIWNADGSMAGQCGNGVRCVAAWLYREGLVPLDSDVRLESPSGPVTVRVLAADCVAVDMGEPDFTPESLPFHAETAESYRLTVGKDTVRVAVVSMGNPHAVLQVDDVADPRCDILGPALSGHNAFPQGCNIGFVQRLAPDRIRLRVHERGSGWTLACGTGACAAAAVLLRDAEATSPLTVELPGGSLRIDWAGPGHALWMTGPAAFVFEADYAG
jgi:diaminopimelate epimerase